MNDIYYADSEMDQAEKDINNRIAELIGFTCWKKADNRCDGKRITRCGACGGYGHANCYGDGRGPIQFGCCQVRPNYTQNIEEGYKLLLELNEEKYTVMITKFALNWTVSLARDTKGAAGYAETLPMAICKAYLEWKNA